MTWNLIGQRATVSMWQREHDGTGRTGALVDVFRAKTGDGADEVEAWLTDLHGANRFVETSGGG